MKKHFLRVPLLLALPFAAAGCRSSADDTSVPTQQPQPSEQPQEPEQLPQPEQPDPTAASCGGMQGLACDSGEYCHYEPSATCGAADQMGTCRTAPDFCTEQFDPVCGCDDKTYPNACKANAAGISVGLTEPCPQR